MTTSHAERLLLRYGAILVLVAMLTGPLIGQFPEVELILSAHVAAIIWGTLMVATGAGLYDHFLEQLAFHAGFDLVLEAAGDLETGEHHTAEDAAIALGEALDRALGDRGGIARYGDAVVPMDDALARAAVDLGGRPAAELAFEPLLEDPIGTLARHAA